RYRIAGAVQEFFTETEVVGVVDLTDEGPGVVPVPLIRSVAVLRDTNCTASPTGATGEDYGGGLVRVRNVRIVPFGGSEDAAPGGWFMVVQPPYAASDRILVSNLGNHYTFDPDTGRVLDVAGVLHFTNGGFRILPRGDTDLSYLESMAPTHAGNGGSVSLT